jgi:hypothetical protein
MRYTWSRASNILSVACRTFNGVWPTNRSTIRLWCVGSRCWISTKAMPLFAGNASKNFLKASRPPAEAPNATTGKSTLARFGDARSYGCGRAWPACDGLRPVIFLAFVSPGSHRGTRAAQFHLITTAARERQKGDLRFMPDFGSISQWAIGMSTFRILAATSFPCAHGSGCMRLVVAYSCW